jgi:D-alanyl-D-alanine carboxypeptidase
MLRSTLSGVLAAILTVPTIFAAPATAAPATTAPGTAAPATTAPAIGADEAAVLRQLLAEVPRAGMPGAFAQVRDGGQALDVAAGVADVDTGRAVRPDFQHRVGSITKTSSSAC